MFICPQAKTYLYNVNVYVASITEMDALRMDTSKS